jgi:uncharacterized protein (TIGR02231 family)
MKKNLLILFCAVAFTVAAQDVVSKPIQVPVNEVTVFLQNALETRRTTVDVDQGKTRLLFTGLSPYIDASSIQARVNGAVTLLMVNHHQNFLDKSVPAPEIKALQDKLTAVEKKIATQTTLMEVLSEDLEYLKANRDLKGTNSNITLAVIREGATYFNERVTALKLKNIDYLQALEELKLQRKDLLSQLSSLKAKDGSATGEVEVLVDASKATKIDVVLSCLVMNAGWSPGYDIRAKSLGEPLSVVYKATVWQNTKTDWKNVKLKLSSYNPTVSGVAPSLDPYRLDYPRPVLMTRSMSLKTASIADGNRANELALEDGAGLRIPARGAQAALPERTKVESPMSVDFSIQVPYTILSDGKNVVVEMDRLNLPAEYQYFTIPKLSSDVFLTANIKDWEKYSFLSGEANVFFEDSYVGKTYLDVNQVLDTLTISLGVDKRILVKREKLKDFVTKRFIGSKKEDTRVWKTIVRNTRTEPISLQMLDQVPVSANSEIEVSYQATPASQFDASTGEIRWDGQVIPGKENAYELKYTVRYPKNKSLVVE